ncbi:Xaa-Pro dipeptidase [Ferrimonas balearica]|uniref:Xaa-Pro dipeptidase n=1 Tax=Ferrimonas balearica TaxID=44012 RepID=UPI001C58DEE8|nr:Xaa-Pro dipeptidase [Ferrimonas balearica]MBW3141692.1 Xaa-Pro dipeptidase [Ferrimonas balearica]MBY6108752.1 Xaa-Pro dipeptidase [Ferrimonas balearica]
MERLAHTYPDHIQTLRQRADALLAEHELEGMIIHAGEPHRIFLDDMDYPFKVNPHFKHWVPVVDNPHCYLVVKAGEKPTLLFYRPVDFWHKVPPLPTEYWVEQVNLVAFAKLDEVAGLLPAERSRFAYIGEHSQRAAELGLNLINPQALMDALHFRRSIKTDYEIACMDEANRIAVLGHIAARDAFLAGGSEFAIQQAYLTATEHGENDVPYGNIVALNEHSAILHYTKLERQAPAESRSFLIDAGAAVNGYAADITRTYAKDPDSRFGRLVAAMDEAQLEIIDAIRPGLRYTELHEMMHRKVAELMVRFELANASAEQVFESGLTRAFFPHGLGHPIGLQVHDVAGFMQDEQGTLLAAPEAYPALRCTRVLEPGMVVTIEPGLYIIDTLIEDLPADARALLNTAVIDELRPFGGIRIEDDVVVTENGILNLTRKHGLA